MWALTQSIETQRLKAQAQDEAQHIKNQCREAQAQCIQDLTQLMETLQSMLSKETCGEELIYQLIASMGEEENDSEGGEDFNDSEGGVYKHDDEKPITILD